MSDEETLSRTEMMIEQEKLKLERERMLLERERLEAVRERSNAEKDLRIDDKGKKVVSIESVVMVSIICLLLGGIVGAFSTSLRINYLRNSKNKLVSELVQSISGISPENGIDNQLVSVTNMPPWLKTMKPKESHAGISLIVIQ